LKEKAAQAAALAAEKAQAVAEQAEERRATRAAEQAERDRSSEERDAAERKRREKELIEEERARIKADKEARAEAQRAEREAAREQRDREKAAREEERAAEKEFKAAGRALSKPAKKEVEAPAAPSFTGFFSKAAASADEDDEPVFAKTQKIKAPAPPARTQLMSKPKEMKPSSSESALPSNFPTVADLQGLDKEAKLALADEAEAYAERLASKADAAEKFAASFVVSVLFFLKSGAEKQSIRAREVADLAAVEAAKIRASANGGGAGALVGAGAAALIIAGAAAVALSGGFSLPTSIEPSTPTVKITNNSNNPRAKATSPSFAGASKKAPALRDVEAMQAMERVTSGELDAMTLYEQLRR
jgi:hypothetical protein